MILQTLYQQNVKQGTTFFHGFYVLTCSLPPKGPAASRGPPVVYRRGLPLQDMEFFQFHPTGLYRLGILLSEAARGEGGIFRNRDGEAFMERYAPTIKDLAPRDLASRAIYTEIRQGRGAGPDGDYVYLDVSHLDPKVIDAKLPDITEFARPARDRRAGVPAGPGRGAGGLGPGPHREPRRPLPRGLPEARRCDLAAAHPGVEGRRGQARLQAGDDHPLPADGENLLMDVSLPVRRFNPETDQASHVETYQVPAEPMDRVLDLLDYVKWNLDGSLTFRRSCAHGVCGSDAMLINGANRLACKVLVRELGEQITVEPLRGLPVKKDLLVDMDPFFESYREVLPFLINDEPAPDTERRQSPEQRRRFDDTTRCILCAACTTSCPVFWADDRYFGPASIVNAHRFIFDSRDQGTAAPGRAERQGGSVTMSHDLQLHGRLPPGDQGHPGDPGGQARPAVPQDVEGG
jgi:succinate dehydrogenase / fumarate reductase iron-sulfur subunit